MEPEANMFAREMLFSAEKVNYIRQFIDSPRVVEQYAEQYKVHPSIIYSIFIRSLEDAHPGADYSSWYARYNSYLNVSPDKAIKAINTLVHGNVKEDAARVKQAYTSAINS